MPGMPGMPGERAPRRRQRWREIYQRSVETLPRHCSRVTGWHVGPGAPGSLGGASGARSPGLPCVALRATVLAGAERDAGASPITSRSPALQVRHCIRRGAPATRAHLRRQRPRGCAARDGDAGTQRACWRVRSACRYAGRRLDGRAASIVTRALHISSPSQTRAKTRRGERMRSARRACQAARAITQTVAYARATRVSTADEPKTGIPWNSTTQPANQPHLGDLR
jgi:hypothetical protein